MKIRSNHNFRDLLSGWELNDNERNELDYIAEPNNLEAWGQEVNRFFRYRGQVYDTNEFQPIFIRGENNQPLPFHCGISAEQNSPLANWGAIQTDSFFSGIVISFDESAERVRVGLATW